MTPLLITLLIVAGIALLIVIGYLNNVVENGKLERARTKIELADRLRRGQRREVLVQTDPLGGGSLGLVLGGPLGALLGALAGHMLVDREGAPFGAAPRELVFTTGLVALAAKMARIVWVVLTKPGALYERRDPAFA